MKTIDVGNFVNYLEKEILKIKNSIVLGDLNIHIVNMNNEAVNYLHSVYSNGFICLNSINSGIYTRKGTSCCTIIDHILSDKTDFNYIIALDDDPISDHRLISLDICNSKVERRRRQITRSKSLITLNLKKLI